MNTLSVLAAALLTLQVNTSSQSAPTTFGGQQRTPPRDATAEKKGTAIVRGKIVNAEGASATPSSIAIERRFDTRRTDDEYQRGGTV
jgi:hypothetical protein